MRFLAEFFKYKSFENTFIQFADYLENSVTFVMREEIFSL